MAALTGTSGEATADLETLGAGMRSRSDALMATYPTDEQATENRMAMELSEPLQAAAPSNERYRASRPWLMGFIVLDTQLAATARSAAAATARSAAAAIFT